MNHSKNSHGADNQQERLADWIVGFVDGEGTFSVSLNHNSTTLTGYQVFPEFVVTQGAKSLAAIQLIRDYFKIGKIYKNHRYDNHREDMYRYVVRSFHDLTTTIIPFFQKNELKTAKQNDFLKFCEVIELMKEKEHTTSEGVAKIRLILNQMNRRSRILRH